MICFKLYTLQSEKNMAEQFTNGAVLQI